MNNSNNMLRHTARPKSQSELASGRKSSVSGSSKIATPKDINNNSRSKTEDDWNQLIDKFKRSASIKDNRVSSSDDLSSSNSNLSSSSSASSLASSLLSLSTNSSTSTVLPALNRMVQANHSDGQAGTKSMIARYTANKESNSKQTVKQVRVQSSEEEDNYYFEEESNQPLSSASSSTSSSSGLSSMNSSTQAVQEEPTAPKAQQIVSSLVDEDVGEFLTELVESVASSECESSSEQADNEVSEFTTFKLHEAVLAKTASTNTSSDEENNTMRKSISSSLGNNNKQMASSCLYSSHLVLKAQVYLVRELEINSELKSYSYLLHSASRYMKSVLSTQKIKTSWFVEINFIDSTIEWRESNRLNEFERLNFDQISDCLIDKQQIVWVLRRDRDFLCQASGSAAKTTIQLGMSDDDCGATTTAAVELETTLDDIALALDEPIEASQHVHAAAATGVETLIWLFSDCDEARRFGDCYKSFQETFQIDAEASAKKLEQRRRTNLLAVDSIAQLTRHVAVDEDVIDEDDSEDNRGNFATTSQSRQQTSRLQADLKAVPSQRAQGKTASGAGPSANHKGEGLIDDHQSSAAGSLEQAPVARNNNNKSARKSQELENRKQTVESAGRDLVSINDDDDDPSKIKYNSTSSSTATTKQSLRKSISGFDLSGQATSGSGGLANYYRSVASKVLSNGQSKIKSFRDEMIKLNNRSSTSAAKRLSMAIQFNNKSPAAKEDSTAAAKADAKSAPAQRNHLSSLIDGQHGPSSNSSDHQRRLSTSVTSLTNGSNNNSNNKIIKLAANNHQSQVPEIKPRTSILKNKQLAAKQQQQNSTCDSAGSNRVRPDEQAENLAINGAKPKSILKTSKSVSNNNIIGFSISKAVGSNRQDDQGAKQINGSHQFSSTSAVAASPYSTTSRATSTVGLQKSLVRAGQLAPSKDNHHYQSMRRPTVYGSSTGASSAASASISQQDRRKSYNLATLKSSSTDQANSSGNNHDDELSIEREISFERLRSRASCYDISRLMSKNGLQNQLIKLRNSANNPNAQYNSIALGKSRQRRPALLIDETDQATDLSGKDSIKTTTSGSDGTVRAQVTLKQQQSKPVSDNQKIKSDTGTTSESILIRQYEGENKSGSVSLQCKKSEFDPRSLRKFPTNSMTIERPKDEEKQQKAGKLALFENRKSITSVRLLSMQQEESASKEPESKNRATNLRIEDEQPEDIDDDDDEEVGDEETNAVSSSLSKNGPFSLLRQSFNQKTLSSMLKFSSRASLRIKSSASEAAATLQPGANELAAADEPQQAKPISDKQTAIAVAEANLLAAKQLKQQAQKLKEQQKREQQQQQAALMDPTSIMLAVQYNQQVQRQQQMQQQLYQQQQQQQQYAFASRSQLFGADPTGMHQMMIQRYQQHQQQQQMANYVASLNTAHYVAQQMAVAATAVLPPPIAPPTMPVAANQLMYQAAVSSQPAYAAVSSSKRTVSSKVNSNSQLLYQHHQQSHHHHQQIIPMSVNHHSSSFNIVYANQAPNEQPTSDGHNHQANQAETKLLAGKSSSLGASMRKTVKSILINRSGFLSSSSPSSTAAATASATTLASKDSQARPQSNQAKLKSALKASVSNNSSMIVLNSEGSDDYDNSSSSSGDYSSSTTITSDLIRNGKGAHHHQQQVQPVKSALKKQSVSTDSDPSSSESSCSSSNESDYRLQSDHFKQNLKINNQDLSRASMRRKSVMAVDGNNNNTNSSSGTGRKNVTFSTKLTSIL